MSDRLNKVTIGVYDQVVALTQYLINSGIDSLYLQVSEGRDTPLKFNLSHRGNGSFNNIELGSPRIVIETAPGNTSLVTYRVHIKTGVLSLFMTDDEDDQSMINYNTNDWYFAFPVNIGLVGLEESSQKYQDVRALMDKPGDYTIQQLLVDMTTAQFEIPKESMCSFGTWSADDYITDNQGVHQTPPNAVVGQTRDWSKETENVRTQFTRFLEDITKKLLAAGLQDLGYTAAAKTVDPGAHEPTFVPTDLRFQTYPWSDPSNKTAPPVSGLTGNGVLNYLLYLETTDNHTLPSSTSSDAFLPISNGNWTDGTQPGTDSPSKFGSMVISGKNFMDIFFLPKMKKLNRMIAAQILTLTAYVHQTAGPFAQHSELTYSVGIGYGVRDFDVVDPDDDPYAFAKGSSAGWGEGYPALPNNAIEWVWSKNYPEIHSHDSSGIWGSESYGDAYGEVGNGARLWTVPGTNKLTLEARSKIRVRWYLNPNRLDPNKTLGDLTSIATWKVEFTLQEVSDGGLHIGITRNDPVVTFSGSGLDNLRTQITDRYQTARQNFNNLVTGLDNALQGQEKFYFPSRGTFFIKNPLFDFQANLVCELEYNGDTSTGTPNPDAIQRPDAITGSFAAIPAVDHTASSDNQK